MLDACLIGGSKCTIKSWDGYRLNTKPHGPGTLVDTDGWTRQCTLNQGVISGHSWGTDTDGTKYAQVYNAQGMLHGTEVVFLPWGDVAIYVYNNGKQESHVDGMMCSYTWYALIIVH